MIRAMTLCGFLFSLPVMPAVRGQSIQISEDDEQIKIVTPHLEAAIRKQGYVSGVAGGTFVDKKTGAKDLGFGLDIADWIMVPGSDQEYRQE